MSTTYTTQAKVEYMIENLDASLTPTHFTQFIRQAKAIVVGTMQFEYTTRVPELVEQVTTDLAALYAFNFNPEASASYQYAARIMALLETRVKNGLNLLKSSEVKAFYKNSGYS